MVLLAAVLGSTVFWTATMPVWMIVVWWFALGLAMGSVMAPATDSVMGAVPLAKAGVGSAMNDVTRQVGGALGVAVIGSLINMLYTTQIGPAVANLPPAMRDKAEASIGAANAVSQHAPAAGGDRLAAAADAFTTAMGYGLLAAAALCLVGAGVVVWKLPARGPGQPPT